VHRLQLDIRHNVCIDQTNMNVILFNCIDSMKKYDTKKIYPLIVDISQTKTTKIEGSPIEKWIIIIITMRMTLGKGGLGQRIPERSIAN
jgi:hypothetical protein